MKIKSIYQCEEAVSLIKENLAGLPGFCRLAIYDLLEYCDYTTGIISISALDEVAVNDFYVTPSPGRKKEVVNSDTIRNAFRTIKKAKSDSFIFSSVNQRVVIEMPFLRELYQSICNGTPEHAEVLATDVVIPETLAQSSESVDFKPLLTEDVVGDLAAATSPISPVKKNNINNKNKTNKHTATVIFADNW